MQTLRELFTKLPIIKHDDKILLLTHTDLDGEGAVILLNSLFENVTVKRCSNAVMDKEIRNAIQPEIINNYDKIVICDISCTKETADLIRYNPYMDKIILIDHHKTAMYLNNYPFAVVYSDMVSDSFRADIYYDENDWPNAHSSATGLLYDYLDITGHTARFGNRYLARLFTHLVSCYDTWDWVNIFNKTETAPIALNNLFHIYGHKLFDEHMIDKLTDKKATDLIDETDTLLLKIDQYKREETIEKASKSIKTGILTIDNKTYSIAICFINEHMNSVFEYMKTEYPDTDIQIIITPRSINMRTAKNDIDISVIAKQAGGGGHPQASGITIDYRDQMDFIANAMNATITLD